MLINTSLPTPAGGGLPASSASASPTSPTSPGSQSLQPSTGPASMGGTPLSVAMSSAPRQVFALGNSASDGMMGVALAGADNAFSEGDAKMAVRMGKSLLGLISDR